MKIRVQVYTKTEEEITKRRVIENNLASLLGSFMASSEHAMGVAIRVDIENNVEAVETLEGVYERTKEYLRNNNGLTTQKT